MHNFLPQITPFAVNGCRVGSTRADKSSKIAVPGKSRGSGRRDGEVGLQRSCCKKQQLANSSAKVGNDSTPHGREMAPGSSRFFAELIFPPPELPSIAWRALHAKAALQAIGDDIFRLHPPRCRNRRSPTLSSSDRGCGGGCSQLLSGIKIALDTGSWD